MALRAIGLTAYLSADLLHVTGRLHYGFALGSPMLEKLKWIAADARFELASPQWSNGEQRRQRPWIRHGSCFFHLIGLALLLSRGCGMRNALRLIVALALGCCCAAHAVVPTGQQYTPFISAKNWRGTTTGDPNAACVQLGAYEGPAMYGYDRYANVTYGGDGWCLAAIIYPSATSGSNVCYSNACGLLGRLEVVSACPANSTAVSGGCRCDTKFQENAAQTACEAAVPERESLTDQACKAPVAGASTPFPITPATAEKYRWEPDWTDAGPAALSLVRTYRSNWGPDASRPVGALGKTWTHNHSTSLKVTARDAAASPQAVAITTSEGYLRTFFKRAQASVWTATNGADTLTGNGPWTYHRAEDDLTQSFDADGHLLAQTERNGWTTTYAYSGGHLASVTNPFGRTLSFQYSGDRLVSVTTPDARVISYGYDSTGRLISVTYPDAKTRSFVYENTSFSHALTGIFDETGARWGTFAYDTQGRAISTELAGTVERYQVSYPSGTSASVMDPLGTTRSYSYGTTFGKLAVTGGSLPSGTGESDASSRVQDANGLITSETDFQGVQTTTTWDVARRLPTSVTRAAGTPEAQTTTTQWHATWALPVLVTEAGRTTAYTYDTQGRPLTQTVTHTAAGNKTQTTSWTYTPQGLVATETAPNGAATSYAYDSFGNVLSATNALGHVSSYTYDSANRMLSQTAPNGLVTSYTWDARDRLLTQTVGGQQTTTLTYTPFGAIATLTLPTGLSLGYSYDAAHRLTGWSNNRGESGSYTLDAMGNRTGEQILSSAGAIAWTTARTVNNINRLTAQTEGSNQTSTFGYDANGERVRETNGLNQSTQYGLDGLRRVKTLTNAANASAGLSYNALDAVTQASDFKGVATSYARDAQGNATAESSADIGARSTAYDALGLPSQIVDALGQATTIQRDALGRPTQLSFADGKITTLRYDLSGDTYNAPGSPSASIGYLSEMQDRSGTTGYQRDAFGRVTRKWLSWATGLAGSSTYTYNAAGLLDTFLYPGGPDHTLQYLYDGTGRLTGMNWKGQPLISGITWNPMGQPTGWTWLFKPVFGDSAADFATTRTYDTAGRLTNVTLGGQTVLGYVYDAAGRVTSLSQLLAEPVTPNDPNSAVTSTLRSWLAGYDATGRLTSLNQSGTGAPVDTAGFSYDANGNRTASTRVVGGITTSRDYSVSANQLTGFGQVIGGTSTSVAYGYNTNGDMVSDGLRTYTYDAEGRLSTATTGATDYSPTTRYAHNALGQRVFKTEPQYPPAEGDETDAGFMQSLINFFKQLWSPSTSQAEAYGYAYAYDEQGTLIGDYGMGGAHSSGSKQYVYLPTAAGPMPIVVMTDDTRYAVVADHLNTPRRATYPDGDLRWQWGYSAFGDEQPTVADRRFNKVAPLESDFSINLRYPGQYFDAESGLHYNGFRTYNPTVGRYTQGDPIGLAAGFNQFVYVGANPLKYSDPKGLLLPALAIPLIGGGSIGLGEVGLGTALGALLFTPGDTQPKPPEPMLYNPGYKPGSWPPPPPAPPADRPEAWPGGDDWRGQCIRLYAQCQRDDWTGNCSACLNKCTAQQEWPFQGPGACRPRKKSGSCPAF